MPRERIRDPLIEGKSHKEHPGINLNNIVLWVNKDEENFSIKEGEKYGGPLFFGYEIPGVKLIKGIIKRRNHNRVFSFPEFKNWFPFKYYSIKGVGGFKDFTLTHETFRKLSNEKELSYYGLYDLESAKWDRDHSLRLKDLGCRVVEPVAIVRLLELPVPERKAGPVERLTRRIFGELDQAKLLPTQQAIDEVNMVEFEEGKFLKSHDKPYDAVAYIRKARSPYRLLDLKDVIPPFEQRTSTLKVGVAGKEVNIARRTLKKVFDKTFQDLELEFKEKFTPEKYLKWFAKTMGESVGRMHGAGFIHKFLHFGNITLSAELVDADSVTEPTIEDEEEYTGQLDLFEDEDKVRKDYRESSLERDISEHDENFESQYGVELAIIELASYVFTLFHKDFGVDKYNDQTGGEYLFGLYDDLTAIFKESYNKEILK